MKNRNRRGFEEGKRMKEHSASPIGFFQRSLTPRVLPGRGLNLALFVTVSPAALATKGGVPTEVPDITLPLKIANETKGGFPS